LAELVNTCSPYNLLRKVFNLMRLSFAAPALVAALCFSLVSAARAELTIGDAAPALKVAKWVKGSPVTLSKGKVHVVEFWATWCGPCKTSIPHLTQLAKQYKGKADFTGVSVWESNPQVPLTLPQITTKVKKFVASMGAKMDYSVAIDDKPEKGTMASGWMEASGSDGIPTAFIVDKTGKVAWIGHPMEMEEPLAKIVAGKWDVDAAKKKAAAEKAAAEKEAAQQQALEGKLQAFDKEFKGLLEADKISEALALADKTATESPIPISQLYNQLAWTFVEGQKQVPPPFTKLKDSALVMAQKAVELTKGEDGMILDTLAFIHYKAGNLKEALALQIKAVEKLPAGIPDDLKKEVVDRLALYKSKSK
jgi:thiol-disulfide isomerase/thioredoxin